MWGFWLQAGGGSRAARRRGLADGMAARGDAMIGVAKVGTGRRTGVICTAVA